MTHRLASLAIVAAIAITSCGTRPATAPVPLTRQYVTTPIAANALDFLYFTIAEKAHLEAWFCLRGFVDRRSWNTLIQNISPIYVDSADEANIHGRPGDCAKGPDSTSIIGTVHFHPDLNECEFSDVDIVTAHFLPYQIEAIVCRDDANPRPHLKLAYRDQIDSAYRAIPKGPGIAGPARTFTAVYKYTPER